MKKVSLRSFQLKATRFLKELPIALTRYGKPIAIVSPLSSFEGFSKLSEKQSISDLEKIYPKVEKKPLAEKHA